MIKPLFAVATVAALSGCASVVSGVTQKFFVDTPKVVGAFCTLTDAEKRFWFVRRSPGSVTVEKGDGPMKIVCEKSGYETTTIMVEETIAGSAFGNIIIGGGIGLLIDATTGAAQKYPDRVDVWLKPKKFATRADEEAWDAEKRAYKKRVAEEKAKKEAQQSGG